MCGIVGILNKNGTAVDRAVLERMTRRLIHRGPDDEGFYLDGAIGLGFRRLSIIDLSGGHQPMSTPDGRHTIVFNGEIYNFPELRSELEKGGEAFQTHSDTEVLLRLFVREGERCLSRLNGMFAFAIWDRLEKSLFLARDRMGKKPLYLWETASHFAFASECKSFLEHPQFSKTLDPNALNHFFQYEYVPAPLSIFQNVRKLPQGHFLTYRGGETTIRRYWDVPLVERREVIPEPEAACRLFGLIDSAVERRLISDVPLGVLLSGGLDSSAIVAMMARHRSGREIKTFTIGFREKSYDESAYAKSISDRFGTDHHVQELTEEKLLEIIPEAVSFLDEPFADYSIFPTWLLSKFTRQKMTVALGGDGGDELFAGYPTFFADRVARIFNTLPSPLKKLVAWMAARLPVSDRDMSLDFMVKIFLQGASFPPVVRNQVWLGAFGPEERRSLFLHPPPSDPLDLVSEVMKNCRSSDPGDRILYFYQKFYLCDDILVKTDRASMATSLEVRAPLLDVNVVEFAASLPFSYKLKGTKKKYIFNKLLEPLLPEEILNRKKKGFGIPLSAWLRGKLKERMLETLAPEKIRREGLFRPEFVNQLVQEHLAGKRNHRKPLFALLMFEWWREKYLD